VSGSEPFVARAEGMPDVRGVLHRATASSGDALVLTHGAGASAGSPLLVALAEAFAAEGVTVLRCDLPFRQARATGPPAPRGAGTDRDGLRHAVAVLRATTPGRVFLGGHSYGGRQATMLGAADPSLVAGLLLLAYPLHPPTRPGEVRTAHFPALRTPALFVHGTTDPFGSIEELTAALKLIPATTRLLAVPNAGHDLGRGARAITPGRAFAETVVTAFRDVLAGAAPAQRATGRSSRLPHSTQERS
jgi:predicted alpha/beta-hydrolase family hydrolase